MPVVNYLWNPLNDNIVREFDDSGTVIAEYTTESNMFGNVVSQRRNGQDSVYHYDGQGSTLALTDANGNVTDTYSYSAFGEVTAQAGTTVNPFQYFGRNEYYWDVEAGEYYVRRRLLQQYRGRFGSADPNGKRVAEMNLYPYVLNDPIGHSDPSGLSCFFRDESYNCSLYSTVTDCFTDIRRMMTSSHLNMLVSCAQKRNCLRSCQPIVCANCDETAAYVHNTLLFGTHIELCYDAWSKRTKPEKWYVLYEEVYHALTICDPRWDKEHLDEAFVDFARLATGEGPLNIWIGYDPCVRCIGREVFAKTCAKLMTGNTFPDSPPVLGRIVSEAQASCPACDLNTFLPDSNSYKVLAYWFGTLPQACARINQACDTRDNTIG